MADVVAVGLLTTDMITTGVPVDIFKKDTQFVDGTVIRGGGDAYNVAYNLAALGVESALVACVGEDYFGSHVLQLAHGVGVDVSAAVKCGEAQTATSVVLAEESGERHFLYHPGANNYLCFGAINLQQVAAAKIIHLGSAMALPALDGEGVRKLFTFAKEHGVATCMDVTFDNEGKWLGKIESALYCTDYFVPSYGEAVAITGKQEPEQMAEFFSRYGMKAFVVKLGARGCFATDFKNSAYLPSTAACVVDTTGAGDSFTAGLLADLLRGKDIFKSARTGQRLAACCVAQPGANGYEIDQALLAQFG